MDRYGTGQDPYCYKGTDTLINKLNIRDALELEEAEKEFSMFAVDEIEFEQPPYNLEYLCNIHYQLFSRLYDWAGEIRTIKLTKKRSVFSIPERIKPEANKYFKRLEDSDSFTHLSHHDFVVEMAELYSDINAVHPFREGNGRSQRILFEHIAIFNGYHFNWEDVDRDLWLQANEAGYYGNTMPLIDIFNKILSENAA